MKYLTLNHDLEVQWILNHLKHSFETLKVFTVEDENQGIYNVTLPHLTRYKDSDCHSNIVLATRVHNRELFDSFLNSELFSDRSPVVSCIFSDADTIELSNFFHRDLRKLMINCTKYSVVDLSNCLQSCRFFTHLSLVGTEVKIKIKSNVLLALSSAIREERLPSLKCLRFVKASGLKNRLEYLFDDRSTYSALTHLCFFDCDLTVEDMQTLGAASTNSIPNVTSLVLSDNSDDTGAIASGQWMLFSNRWTNLTRLSILNMTGHSYGTTAHVISEDLLSSLIQLRLSARLGETFSVNQLALDRIPQIKYIGLQRYVWELSDLMKVANMSSKWELRTLDISHSTGTTGNLSQLLSCNFQFLRTLILSDCGLDSEDFSSLAKAKVEGRLEKLIHLDISNNSDNIWSIFNHNCKWERLRRLNLANEGENYRDLLRLDYSLLRDCLPSLREVRWIDFHSLFLHHIQRLEIVPQRKQSIRLTFDELARSVDQNFFPNLETVCFIFNTQEQIEEEFKEDKKFEETLQRFRRSETEFDKDKKMEENLQRLRRAGVIVHFISSDTEKLCAEIGHE